MTMTQGGLSGFREVDIDKPHHIYTCLDLLRSI